jgi:rhodanese-related sulfurtransferase
MDYVQQGGSMNQEIEVTADQIREMLKKGEDLFFLDVRQHLDRDWTLYKARGALVVPDDKIGRHLEQIPCTKRVIVYAATSAEDSLGLKAAEILLEAGYGNINLLVGGLDAYMEAGLPVEETGTATAKKMML